MPRRTLCVTTAAALALTACQPEEAPPPAVSQPPTQTRTATAAGKRTVSGSQEFRTRHRGKERPPQGVAFERGRYSSGTPGTPAPPRPLLNLNSEQKTQLAPLLAQARTPGLQSEDAHKILEKARDLISPEA